MTTNGGVGMRKSSTILIFIDLAAALADGYKFYRSQNDVVLTPGNTAGFLPTKYFARVENAATGAAPFAGFPDAAAWGTTSFARGAPGSREN